MNKVILIGRITKDVEVQHGESTFCRFILAVERRYKKDGEEKTVDFIGCVAFGKSAEFLGKYGSKGTKFVVDGRLQTGSYTNKEGVRVFTTDVIVEHMEFAESKKDGGSSFGVDENGFMQIPDDIDGELPFK